MTDTLSTVQEVFADLTRYPAEILEPTADLEADLGVDSVKRVEIMSKLSEQFGIPQDLDVAPEQLSSIEAIARFIDDARAGKYERRTQVAEPAPAQAAAPAPTPPTARPMQAPALHGTLIPTPPPAPSAICGSYMRSKCVAFEGDVQPASV